MESQSCKNPIQGQNPSDKIYYDHLNYIIVLSLTTLGLLNNNGADDTVEIQRPKPAAKKQQRKSSVFRKPLLSGKESSASDYDSIWGYRFFTYEGDESSISKTHYLNWFPEYLPPSLTTTPCLVNNGYQFNDYEPYPGYRFDQDWNNAITKALGYLADFSGIQEILKGEQCQQKDRLIYALEDFVFILMIDGHMSCMFTALVDACKEKHLNSLVRKIQSGSENFINTSFCDQGVKSMVKLITKLKKSNNAFTVAKILSMKLLDMMTDQRARRVIQQCFIVFRQAHNKTLYERVIQHCYELAKHKVGCKSLNDCLKMIAGEQRSRLFNRIADASFDLSIDPYGNYVLQFCLDQHYEEGTARILSALKGHHILLAQNKEGSNVVEKCMECSKNGLIDVVNEILKSPKKTLIWLAQDHFGNYVIQKALKMTFSWKHECGFTILHNSLVNSLKCFHNDLSRTTGGRKVIKLMEGQRLSEIKNIV